MSRAETILCIPSTSPELQGAEGFQALTESALSSLLRPGNAWFGPRQALEHDDRFRQVIPYVVLHCASKVYSYRRGQASNEDRLRGRTSIGFGGHVTLADLVTIAGQVDVTATLRTAVTRELHEELQLPAVLAKRTIGILCTSDTPVSRVHVGIVELWALQNVDVRPLEATVEELTLSDVAQLTCSLEDMEDWSRLTASCLHPLLAQPEQTGPTRNWI